MLFLSGTISGLVVLIFIQKLRKQKRALPRHEFLTPGFCPTGCSVFTDFAYELSYETVSEINSILPKLLLVMVFLITATGSKLGQPTFLVHNFILISRSSVSFCPLLVLQVDHLGAFLNVSHHCSQRFHA